MPCELISTNSMNRPLCLWVALFIYKVLPHSAPVFKFLAALCSYCGSGIPKDTREKIFLACPPCGPWQKRTGSCCPSEFIGSDTKWPFHHHHCTQICSHFSERRLDGAILNSYSEIYGPSEQQERHVECDGERARGVYKYQGIHFGV